MDNEIMLSVMVVVYNHETYLRQSLDSVLMQNTDFLYEILVIDDCSTDHSQDIIREYKAKYPDKFRIFLRKKNVGGTKNVYCLEQRARGKYIAQLEGDDYWTDPFKLQKQVDFLERNKGYIGCSHECLVVNENNEPIPDRNKNDVKTFWYFEKNKYTLEDFNQGKYPGQCNTWVYRNIFIEKKYDYSIVYKVHKLIADRTTLLFLAAQGNFYFMNEKMGNYRYVEKKTADNWQSLARKTNRRYEEFAYICAIEKYGKEVMKKPVDLSYVKKDKMVCAAVVLLNHWNMENFKVVTGMIHVSGTPFRMFVLSLRAMLQKLYYRKIFGEDRPIKID